MQRKTQTFAITDFKETKKRLLYWANQYGSCTFLDNHQYTSAYNSAECLVAVGALKTFCPTRNYQDALQTFLKETNDWLFGHISYDYKNELITSLGSEHTDYIDFALIQFFQPEIVLQLFPDKLSIHSATHSPESIFEQINSVKIQAESDVSNTSNLSIVKTNKDVKDVYYVFNLNLIDNESGLIEWADEKEIRKTPTR